MSIPIHITPTLFIFLGTSSGDIGWRTKKLITDVYGDIPIIRYLWVDTDTRRDSDPRSIFTDEERAELVGFNIGDVVANIESYKSIKPWWPEDSRMSRQTISTGAPEQIRLAGRLALFRMYQDRMSGVAFIDKLEAAVSSITEINNLNQTAAMRHPIFKFEPDKQTAHVYLIFSTCGGTGSAISFDMAYLCRYLLKTKNPKVFGLSVLPPVIERAIRSEARPQRDKVHANTYAWFKEDQYLIENPHWFVTYPDDTEVEVNSHPFDIHYLIDIMNQNGQSFDSFNDAAIMSAWALFMAIGGNVAGSLNSFTTNVSSLDNEFMQRRTAYSSMVSAALMFPINKIKQYCGAKMGVELVRRGLMADADMDKVNSQINHFISETGLGDMELVNELKTDVEVSFLNKPLLLNTKSVGDAISLLDAQFSSSDDEIDEIEKKIKERSQGLRADLDAKLEKEIAGMSLAQGLPASKAFIHLLLEKTGKSKQGNSLQVYLDRVNAPDYKPEALSKDYLKKVEKIRKQEGGIEDTIMQAAMRKKWESNLKLAITDAVAALENLQNEKITYFARREAKAIYHHLISRLNEHLAALSTLEKSQQGVANQLANQQKEALSPATERQGIFDLSRELLCEEDYFKTFYENNAAKIEVQTVYNEFSGTHRFETLSSLKTFFESGLSTAIINSAGENFGPALEKISLLTALEEYYGDRAKQIIEDEFDQLIKYSVAFWSYDANKGHTSTEGTSIMGIEDASHHLIPEKYANSNIFELKSTGLKHYILLLRVQHGVPAFLLNGMNDNKAKYEQLINKGKSLHVLPNMALAEDVFPELHKHARRVFALANVFGFIVQLGPHFYFDPDRVKVEKNLQPAKKYYLAQGRENADKKFIHLQQFVDEAKQLVDDHIASIGNVEACKKIEDGITWLQTELSNRNTSPSLVEQYDSELESLKEFTRELGCSG